MTNSIPPFGPTPTALATSVGSAIPERVAALTGISDALVAAAPPLDQVMPAFLAFARGGVLIAHNAPFDVGFLTAACQACGLPWPDFPVVDTVELARWALREDEVPNCKLSTLAAFFGARTTPQHRALADALATADVLLGLCDFRRGLRAVVRV